MVVPERRIRPLAEPTDGEGRAVHTVDQTRELEEQTDTAATEGLVDGVESCVTWSWRRRARVIG